MSNAKLAAEVTTDIVGLMLAHALFWALSVLVAWIPLWAGWDYGMALLLGAHPLGILEALAVSCFLNTIVWIVVAGGKMAIR